MQYRCTGSHEAPQQIVPRHSHPSSGAGAEGRLQFMTPGAQAVVVQTPLAQDRGPTTLLDEQTRPQPPQWNTEVAESVSQPSVLAPMALQSARPGAQLYEHIPPSQLRPRLSKPVLHASPHPPQLLAVLVLVSQPARLGATVKQSAQPLVQPE
jgi:hypothetical protein